MKKSIGVFITLVCIVVSTSVVFAQNISEKITHFDVTARINTDATIDVREAIVYNFGSAERHGIFREIPRKYNTSAGNQSVVFKNISVEDEKGTPYQFTTSHKGNNLEIKIGDPNTTVTGVHTYIISYKADRVVGYFKNVDELYWNVTGNNWNVPIDAASATIYLPKDFKETEIQNACYFGPRGSSEQCPIVTMKTGDTVHAVNFAINSLQAGEGLTVATGFPKGVVHEPSLAERAWNLITDNWILCLPLIVFAFMFSQWWKKGRDPKGRGTIVPEYDAPDNITPLEASVVLHQSPQNKDISAQIIFLATHGFLKIARGEEKAFLSTKVDYALTKTKNIPETTNSIDNALLTALYSDDTGNEQVNTLLLSSLKQKFYTKLPAIKKAAIESVIAKGYYPTDPQKVMGKYIGFAVIFFILLWIMGMLDMLNAVSIGSIVGSGIIIGIFAFIMPKVTQEGAIMRERLEGLKLYIKIAEEERIKFHNAPEKNPELFEKLLPFAMLFGLEKEWAKQFEGILTTPPSWYSDPSGHAFNAVLFSNNLSSFSSAAASTLSSAPGGHSGSGGGGFSGGGGGGGGGGSW